MVNLAQDAKALEKTNPCFDKKKDFDTEDAALDFAKQEIDKWPIVHVYLRNEKGKVKDIVKYSNGRQVYP
jgi:hypothetical protein